ncbi:50S ribosomal protein L11 methyltransferase [Lapidilactobacillus achengensis]|uniref:50S ribosomal protein L11 methyltransferase n=1 Tax=Lapidilactobacillus achengensis TaxID=2486000 RepID=A0ABW1UM86_9LACO|nr:50S ribosomal protein L11 methyltransferase [Lapidilactobacillus achengensis]
MNWEQIRIDCPAAALDLIANQLIELGTGGVQILDQETAATTTAVLAYLPADEELDKFVAAVTARLGNLQTEGFLHGPWHLSTRQIDGQASATAWEAYYHVQHLTRFITVVPQWEPYQPTASGEIVIRLDPGRSFGTGMHPTTQLAVAALELAMRPQMRVFDVGTGSGILSLVAKSLGAATIQATELDEAALAFTCKNLELNQAADQIQLYAGSLLTPIVGQADLIIANMLPEALLPLIPQLDHHLAVDGQVILTGIIAEQLPKITAALTAAGFVSSLTLSQGPWSCLNCRRKTEVA